MIRLAYPTVAGPEEFIELVDCEALPRSRPVRGLQSSTMTDALIPAVCDFGGDVQVFSIKLVHLSEADANAIKDFFRLPVGSGGVNKRAGIWEFQDSDGTVYSVSFVQDVLEPLQRGPSDWEVAIALQVRT